MLSWPLGWRQVLAIAALGAAALTLLGDLPLWLSLILVGSPAAAVLGRSTHDGGGESSQDSNGGDADGDGGGGSE